MKEFIPFLVANWHLSLLFAAILIAIIVVEFQMKSSGVGGVSPSEMTTMINRSHAVVFDLRDESSFQNGHIVGAVHLPHDDITARVAKLQKHKKKPCILVDSDGRGFSDSVKKFQSEGFEQVFGLKGGIQAWKEAGMPLTAASANG